jgi:transcriptional regulator GlxA family with amidase domain
MFFMGLLAGTAEGFMPTLAHAFNVNARTLKRIFESYVKSSFQVVWKE